jgi:TPR repeat protein
MSGLGELPKWVSLFKIVGSITLINSIGLAKAEYAVGFFTEMGMGTRRDPLEANVWYVKAAEHGDDRAKLRLANIRAAASGQVSQVAVSTSPKGGKKGGKLEKKDKELPVGKDEKDCVVM